MAAAIAAADLVAWAASASCTRHCACANERLLGSISAFHGLASVDRHMTTEGTYAELIHIYVISAELDVCLEGCP